MASASLGRRLSAETLGTALLLAAVVGSGAMADGLAQGNEALALLANSIATAAVLSTAILIFGPVSGAHLNPVVSLVMVLTGRLHRRELGAYALAQCIGAGAGVVAANLMFGMPAIVFSGHSRTGGAAWLSEGIATFGLIMVILGCLARARQALPWAVGLYIAGAYWFTASTAFANPAATLARALTDSFAGIAPADTAPFIVAQCLGALAAMSVGLWLWERQVRTPAA